MDSLICLNVIYFAAVDVLDEGQAANGIGVDKSHYHYHNLQLETDSYSNNINSKTDHTTILDPLLLFLNSRATLLLASVAAGAGSMELFDKRLLS